MGDPYPKGMMEAMARKEARKRHASSKSKPAKKRAAKKSTATAVETNGDD